MKILSRIFLSAIVGAWGGKWDNRWPVFFVIVDTGEPTYKVFYKWKERVDGPYSLSDGMARGGLSEVQFSNINISIDPDNSDKAIAKGDFPTPRKANLIRLPPSPIENLDLKEFN